MSAAATRIAPLTLGAAWVATTGLGAVALVRVLRPETVPLLIGVQGVAHLALLGAYPLVVLAVRRRRLGLLLASLALGVLQVVLMTGAIGWHGPQALPADHQAIRVVSANVLLDNPSLGGLADDVASEGADVVLLQEVTPQVLERLRSTALWARYPYRSLAPRPAFHGSATFSRDPITRQRTIDVAGSPMLVTDLLTAAGPLRVVNVHTVAPLTGPDARTWADQLDALAGLVERSPSPVVLAGDFNATLDHAPLDRLVGGDVRDAFEVAGTGLGATWPRWSRWPGLVPPLMRLDHVLVAGDVSVASLEARASVGSDHLRLVADLGMGTDRGPAG